MPERLRVAIVEDHALTRVGLRTALSPAFALAGEAADGIEAWEMIRRERPDVALVDIGLPGMDGIALTQRIRREMPATRVVIVTMVDAQDEVLAALAAGADAYVLKTAEPERILEAVRIAGEGGVYLDPRVAHIALGRICGDESRVRTFSPLSPRETEILRLIADGTGNNEIAAQLNIGLGTVKGHIRDILEKLAASDRTQAAVVALRRGFI